MGTQAMPEPAEVLDAVRRIVRALRESSRRAEKLAGISGAQLFVLQQLRGSEALSLRQVSERTLTHESSVSVVVQRLVDAGLVSRRRSPSDARKVELSLTAQGRKAIDGAPRLFQERLIESVGRLAPSARRGLARGLRALVEDMGLAGEAPATMFFEERR